MLLEAARADREGAGEILGLLRPEEVEVPPFEAVLERRAGSGGPAPTASTSRPTGSRMTSLAWAATVVLALGSGWVARGLLSSPSFQERAAADVASLEAPAGAAGQAPSDPVDAAPAQQESVSQLATDAEPSVAPGFAGAPEPEAAAELPAAPARAAEMEAQATQELQADLGADGVERLAAAPPVAQARAEPAVGADAAAVGAFDGAAVANRAAGAAVGGRIEAEFRRADGPDGDAADANALADQVAAIDEMQLAEESVAMDPSLAMELFTSRAVSATEGGRWVATNPADAARRLGREPLGIEGLPWERMELADVDGTILVRTFHPTDEGALVELVQGPSGSTSQPSRAREAQRAILERDAARAPNALPGGEPTVMSEIEGIALMLRGLENRQALESLLPLIR